ncbi:MAG: D-methionine-binding lipoprotein MetQ [Chlamydiae bacterium]|nr:D-methionine-binding lipoprotein MetQ [Chlamydiota bacterium]
MRKLLSLLLLSSLLFSGCNKDKTVKIAATPVPHVDLLEVIRSDLAEDGIVIKIVEVDDYVLPNRLLAEKQVDANFFQHEPYLDLQKKQFGYELVPLVAVHIEPLGIYSNKIESLQEILEGSKVSIPSDPTNESRALQLLEDVDLIKLKIHDKEALLTIHDIAENPKNLKIEELDAAFLPRSLSDVEISVIPVNYALQAKLDPLTDALALESGDSPYANILVIREEDLNKPEFEKLKQALTSDKLRKHINAQYGGSITPAF